jgi:VCBS repeat-containing protein
VALDFTSSTAGDNVDYSPAIETAIANAISGLAAGHGVSYNDATNELSFTGGGVSSLSFTVTATDDAFIENPDETIVVSLGTTDIDQGPTPTIAAGQGTATATITDFDTNITAYDSEVTVNEAALDQNALPDGDDLAVGTVTGRLPGSADETAGSTLTSSGGYAPLAYALVDSPTGTYGTIQVNSNGTYTYTLTSPVDGPTANDGTNTIVDAESFTYRVTDNYGNTTTATIDINVIDDVPSAFYPDSTHVEDLATSPDIVEHLNFFPGADGVGTVEFNADALIGQPAQDNNGNLLTFEGQQLNLYYGSNGTDKTVIEAKTAPDGDVGFFIDIDPGANTYTVHSNGMILNGTATFATDLSGVGGGNTAQKAIIDIGGTTNDVMMSTTAGESVNTNRTEIGISDGNSFKFANGLGEGIRFDLVNGLELRPDDTFDYVDHNTAKAWHQTMTWTQGSSGLANFTITAVLANNDDDFYGDVLADDPVVALVTSDFKIYDDNGQLVTDLVAEGISIAQAGTSVTINGLPADYAYEFTSATDFNAVQIDAATGTATFKLGFFSFGEDSFGDPIALSYDVTGVDGDGDSVSGAIDVTFYPDVVTEAGTSASETMTGDADDNVLLADGGNDILYGLDGDDVLDSNSGTDTLYGGNDNDSLYGGSGGDTLDGGSGNDLLDGGSGRDNLIGGDGEDILFGGIGNDSLNGGSDADSFIFSGKAGEGHDTISGFNLSEDALKFSDLLDGGVTGLDDDLTTYANSIGVEVVGADLVLTIPEQGGGVNETAVTLAGLGGEYAGYDGGTLGDMINDTVINVDTYSS